jgi:hypothetical protein
LTELSLCATFDDHGTSKEAVRMTGLRLVVAATVSFASLLAIGSAASAQDRAERHRPPRIVIYPRNWRIEPPPNAKRYCTSWLQKEVRVSGPVIVPHMHCWWQ